MTEHRNDSNAPNALPPLRDLAEASLSGAPPLESALTPEALLHELQVHQIQLEMQNETLRQTQAALEESRDRYLNLYEFAPVGYLTLTQAGLIAEANQTASILLGVERPRLLNRRLDSFVDATDRESWQRLFHNAVDRQSKQHMTLRLRGRDAPGCWIHLDCRRAEDGVGPATLRITLADVTESTQLAEAALLEKEAQYRTVIETAADGVWVVDEAGCIVAVNEAYARCSGYSREELLKMRVADLEAEESQEEILAHIEKVQRQGSDLFETRHRAKSGELWPVEVNVCFTAAAGGLRYAFLRDIRERKRNEAHLQALRAEMEQVMRHHVARQTVAALAHELNQPLNAVASYSDAALHLLRAGNPQPERLLHALEGASQQARRAGEVVRELLDFVSRGGITAATLNLNDLVRTAISRLSMDRFGPVRTRLDLDPALVPVRADPMQVEKVLMNLIQNGIEAMHGAGVQSRDIRVTVRTHADGEMAWVTVRDSGPGIDDQHLRRIFDPFFTTKPQGLGVGLAISRAIIEAHGGRLWVESEPGVGAAFHFTLPFVS